MTIRKFCGTMVLCALSCALLFSCKKDVSFNSSDNPTADETLTDSNSSSGRLKLTSTYVRKNLLFDYTAESNDALIFNWNLPLTSWHQKYAYSSSSVTRSNTVARSGGYSIKYVLNKSDGMVASGKRAETYRNPRGEAAKVERWYGVSVFLPGDFAYDASPEIVTQWHNLLSYGGPDLAVWTASGTWRVVKVGNISYNVGSYERNKWTDFVFHVKWSSGTDGLLEVWKNGVKIISKTGQTMAAGLTYAPFFRTGLYKWHWNTGSKAVSSTTRRTIYIDEVREGNEYATYADVKPGS